ncbi:hypothetical protein Bint_1419 [Brachyspira intermedia PWS/A]|uniref:Lipoprotein n=1 Tax=Brachyspira intermedia (strain ATCC 51140 / PWS/A) TaxID=1045858 RepID=G0EPX8_BRAIP|nr:hypothetical protein [Brachyspira intermedia]AEM22038.1 hypothetical protein Bint_1419 [Brachyspira intermedia PWS/A]
MKKIILLILTLFIILVACKNDGGSIYAMEQRYRNFLNILPDDVKNDYTLNSDKYGNMYKEWINEFNTWTDNILNEENKREQEISARITPDKIEYALETLTSKDYERNLPVDLMAKVKVHTDQLSLKIDELQKDEAFSNSMIKLKKYEAVENFTTEDTIFYYVWNYLITIERPRRFQ